MLAQSAAQALVCGITVHTFIVGQPFRLRQSRRVLDHLARHADRLWVTTPGPCARHYAQRFPAPASAPTRVTPSPSRPR